MTSMRAKFRVNQIDKYSETSEQIHFAAVSRSTPYPEDGSDEDNTFAKWTPSATCAISITNPALCGKFNVGDLFYVDFTPVDKKAK